MKTHEEVLNRIIDDGIVAARHDYSPENYGDDRPEQRGLLSGSVAGFEACRGKSIPELAIQLKRAERREREAKKRNRLKECSDEDIWFAIGYWHEVHWVCNVISALLWNQGMPVIINPTYRGVMKAADIVGIKGRD